MYDLLVNHFWTYYDRVTVTERKTFKKCFFLKRRSVPFHTLKGRTTNVKFCVGFIFSYPLETKREHVRVGKTACFEFEKLFFFPFYIPKARLRCWFEFKERCYFFGWYFGWLYLTSDRVTERRTSEN